MKTTFTLLWPQLKGAGHKFSLKPGQWKAYRDVVPSKVYTNPVLAALMKAFAKNRLSQQGQGRLIKI
jgi:hypothetical protein